MYFTKNLERNGLLQQKKQPSILTKLKKKNENRRKYSKNSTYFFYPAGVNAYPFGVERQ